MIQSCMKHANRLQVVFVRTVLNGFLKCFTFRVGMLLFSFSSAVFQYSLVSKRSIKILHKTNLRLIIFDTIRKENCDV